MLTTGATVIEYKIGEVALYFFSSSTYLYMRYFS